MANDYSIPTGGGPIPQTSLTVIGLVGKFFASFVWPISLVYTAELYPTTLRNTSLGFHTMFSQLAGLVAPFFILLDRKYGAVATSLPFGLMALLAAAATFGLPETRNVELFEYPEQMERELRYGPTSSSRQDKQAAPSAAALIQ